MNLTIIEKFRLALRNVQTRYSNEGDKNLVSTALHCGAPTWFLKDISVNQLLDDKGKDVISRYIKSAWIESKVSVEDWDTFSEIMCQPYNWQQVDVLCMKANGRLLPYQENKRVYNLGTYKKNQINYNIFKDTTLTNDEMVIIASSIRNDGMSPEEIKKYTGKGFTANQLSVVLDGVAKGIDVTPYAQLKYNTSQMIAFRDAIEAGVDIRPLKRVNPKAPHAEEIMNNITYALKEGVDPNIFAQNFNAKQIEEILLGAISGVDIKQYADIRFSADQMNELRKGLQSGMDITPICKPSLSKEQMKEMKVSITNKEKEELAKSLHPRMTIQDLQKENRETKKSHHHMKPGVKKVKHQNKM